MRTFRAAVLGDLPAIYNLQNVPFRRTAYAGLLPAYENFIYETTGQISRQEKYFYLLEEDGTPNGFAEYTKAVEGWDLVIWGKWLNTLSYVAGKVAFDDLEFSKLNWIVLQSNLRMMGVCKKFQFRLVRTEFTLYYRPGLFSLASAYLNCYEITPEEFREKSDFMRRQSFPVLFR